jgi:hypothetical protein
MIKKFMINQKKVNFIIKKFMINQKNHNFNEIIRIKNFLFMLYG